MHINELEEMIFEDKPLFPPAPYEPARDRPAPTKPYDGRECVLLISDHYTSQEQLGKAIKHLKAQHGDFYLTAAVPDARLVNDEIVLLRAEQYRAMSRGDEARMERHSQQFERGLAAKRRADAEKSK